MPALGASRRVSRPKAASQATQRARTVPAGCPACLISPPNLGLVLQGSAAGTPQRRRRAAAASFATPAWGTERRRAPRVSPWRLASPKETPA